MDTKSELNFYTDNSEKSITMKAHDGYCYILNIVNGEPKAVKVPRPENY